MTDKNLLEFDIDNIEKLIYMFSETDADVFKVKASCLDFDCLEFRVTRIRPGFLGWIRRFFPRSLTFVTKVPIHKS